MFHHDSGNVPINKCDADLSKCTVTHWQQLTLWPGGCVWRWGKHHALIMARQCFSLQFHMLPQPQVRLRCARLRWTADVKAEQAGTGENVFLIHECVSSSQSRDFSTVNDSRWQKHCQTLLSSWRACWCTCAVQVHRNNFKKMHSGMDSHGLVHFAIYKLVESTDGPTAEKLCFYSWDREHSSPSPQQPHGTEHSCNCLSFMHHYWPSKLSSIVFRASLFLALPPC